MSSSCAWYKLFEIRRLIFHVGNPRGGSVPSAEVRGMADADIIGMCLLLRVRAVVLVLLLMAGDVERNPGPTLKEGNLLIFQTGRRD